MYIYRVTVHTTNNLQPGDIVSSFKPKVVYCGESEVEARIAYLSNSPLDEHGTPGSRYRETRIEKFPAHDEYLDNDQPITNEGD